MNRKTTIILLFTNILIAQSDSEFIKGFDVSFIPQIEDLGGNYYLDNLQIDPLEIFKMNDINFIRLRLWHSPNDGYYGLEKTLEMASRIKQKGFKFLLDFHYSDTWADPKHQSKPAAWKFIQFQELVDSVYSYTRNVVSAFDSMNVLPDMIQIGNEITGGFLWNDGCVKDSFNTTGQWEKFTNLLKAAAQAIEDAAPGVHIPVMIHSDAGADNYVCRTFFNNLISFQVPFDIIGLTYYTWWQGNIAELEQNINDLGTRFEKDIIVVETAYPWTLAEADTVKNFVDSTSAIEAAYPPTVEGQDSFLTRMIEIIKNIPNGKGKGIFYWAPEYISVPPLYSSWENLTLFDFRGKVLNSIKAFNNHGNDSLRVINAAFNLNTSSHFDTLSSNAFVQVRGELINGPDTLPGGEKISWDAGSGIILKNINGDYWQTAVKLLPGTGLNYKYWIGHDSATSAFPGFGSEGPIIPFDSTGSFRKFVAGTKDTVLSIEYFNPSGDTLDQYWRPFEQKKDSIAVRFKVNMGAAVSGGRFNPEKERVGVKGDQLDSIMVLSWDEAKVLLSRDSLSVNNGSFWSGTAYFPKSAAGLVQSYKFFIENDSGNVLENIPDRSFLIPSGDTTLAWVYFNDRNIITDISGRFPAPDDFILYQNYPNPFNPSTKINFEIKNRTRINLTVFNYLGEEVNTLADAEKDRGRFSVEWTGKNSRGLSVSSGIYFIRLTAGTRTKSIKVLLLK